MSSLSHRRLTQSFFFNSLFFANIYCYFFITRARDAELIDFFQNAPIAMHWLNGDGTVLWANQTELNVLGYTAEEYIGQPIMNFCPDEKELVLEIFKQLGSGNAIADVPVRFRTKDGKIVHLLIDSNVAYNKDGSFGHTRCFIRDDTARKIRDARVQLLLDENERVSWMLCLSFCCGAGDIVCTSSKLIPLPPLSIFYRRV
jgi:PAS domain S-box-containing protein